jgi:hypothetical protein
MRSAALKIHSAQTVIHQIIFHAMLVDGSWLLARSLLSHKQLDHVQLSISLVLSFLFTIDICDILQTATSVGTWAAMHHEERKGPKGKWCLPSYGIINMMFMTVDKKNLRVSSQSLLCRLLTSSLYWRIPLFEVTIISCQHASFFGLGLLLTLHLALTVATIYAYLKYKYLKNLICLLMEVLSGLSASFVLVLFLFNAHLRLDELVGLEYQLVGIFAILASLALQTLALFVFIITLISGFVMTRRKKPFGVVASISPHTAIAKTTPSSPRKQLGVAQSPADQAAPSLLAKADSTVLPQRKLTQNKIIPSSPPKKQLPNAGILKLAAGIKVIVQHKPK